MLPPLVHRTSAGSPALHYVEGPVAGPTLLLLHGLIRNGTDWESLLPKLVQNWHVIAVDQRGHGKSERVANTYHVRDYVRDAVEFVRTHCATPVTVFGHSLGAMVALGLAVECGDKIARVVLEDPPFHTMGQRIGETPFHAQFAGMQSVARSDFDDLEQLTAALAQIELPQGNGVVRLGDLRDRPSLRYLAECLRQADPEIFTPVVSGEWLAEFDHESLWSRVRCPVLLLQADPAAGGMFTDSDVSLARTRLAACQHVDFPGVGHQIHRTLPEKFGALLDQFSSRGN